MNFVFARPAARCFFGRRHCYLRPLSALADLITLLNRAPYSGESDWVFPSLKLKGKKPRVANMLVEDHLRPAAIAAGVLKEGDDIRFGFHTLRHGLCSYLVQQGKNPTTVKELLCHSDVTTILQIYRHGNSADRMAAQGDMLAAFFAPTATVQ